MVRLGTLGLVGIGVAAIFFIFILSRQPRTENPTGALFPALATTQPPSVLNVSPMQSRVLTSEEKALFAGVSLEPVKRVPTEDELRLFRGV